jgi:uncharacterized protein YjbI with pentapeptide repeats
VTGPAGGRWSGLGVTLPAVLLGAWLGWLNGLGGWDVEPAQGACAMERERADQPAVFTRHLGPDCTEQEREAQAVRADEVLAAVKQGRGVDIAGAMIAGDLFFDALPAVTIEAVPDLPAAVREALRARQIAEVRRLGPIIITRSVMRGAIGSTLKDGAMLVQGPVVLTGTTFERAADFSRTVFLGPVDGSDAVFLSPALFVQARFTQPVLFERTAFGPHSRFHRSVFGGPVSFLRAGFNGLSEFLEVTFEKEASFSRAYFKMGTGFSGSRFGGILDFSEAVFEREAFFTFTVFEQDAYFRRSTFRGTADFSDARFEGLDDFSKVLFDAQPNFSRVQVSEARRTPGGLQDPRVMYGIAALLAVFTLGLLWSLRGK